MSWLEGAKRKSETEIKVEQYVNSCSGMVFSKLDDIVVCLWGPIESWPYVTMLGSHGHIKYSKVRNYGGTEFAAVWVSGREREDGWVYGEFRRIPIICSETFEVYLSFDGSGNPRYFESKGLRSIDLAEGSLEDILREHFRQGPLRSRYRR